MIRHEKDGKHVRYYILTIEELRRKMLLGLIDDLLTGEIPEERYIEIKEQIERMK